MASGWGNPNWVKGKSQNPGGKPAKDKKFLEALERAILQDEGQRLRKAAEKLLTLASEGESWAIQMLADRLDGKAVQQVDMQVTREVKELSDAELADIVSRDIASRGRERDAPEASGPSEPQQVH